MRVAEPRGATNAQCSVYGAPWSIQRRSVATWAGVTFFGDFAGGIRLTGSSWTSRFISSLSSALPGMRTLSAASRVSSRSRALRAFASGPWQVKL